MLPAEQPVANYGNPQIEDGHTRIANELLEAITKFDFSKRQYKIVLFVLRKTYGWNKKADVMSLSQILTGTGLERTHACKVINELVSMMVCLKQPHHKGQLIELNKKYKEWKCDQNSHTVTKTAIKCDQNSHSSVAKTATTKDNLKTLTKDKAILLKDYLETCGLEGKKPIPDNDAIFEFTEKAKIPTEFLKLGWLSFRDELVETDKKQKSWPQTFRNYVKNNYLKIWFFDKDGNPTLTVKGQQLQKFYGEAA